MVIWFSQQERERFSAWLKQEAEGTLGIVEQMGKINVPAVVVEHKKREAAALLVVAKMLDSEEDYIV